MLGPTEFSRLPEMLAAHESDELKSSQVPVPIHGESHFTFRVPFDNLKVKIRETFAGRAQILMHLVRSPHRTLLCMPHFHIHAPSLFPSLHPPTSKAHYPGRPPSADGAERR